MTVAAHSSVSEREQRVLDMIAKQRARRPKLRDAHITMAHGAGGKATQTLIEGVLVPAFASPALDALADVATIEAGGARLAFTTDSFVVKPIRFPGGSIGELAVNGTVNDLAMGGARPLALSLAMILEEGLATRRAARRGRGDRARRRGRGRRGHGRRHEGRRARPCRLDVPLHDRASASSTSAPRLAPSNLRAGDRVLVSGSIGEHGTAIMLARGEFDLDADVESDTRPLWPAVDALLGAAGPHLRCLRDATRGGVASVLNELARASEAAIVVREHDIPVRPAVAGAAELLGIDPMYIANEGTFVAFVGPRRRGSRAGRAARRAGVRERRRDRRGQVLAGRDGADGNRVWRQAGGRPAGRRSRCRASVDRARELSMSSIEFAPKQKATEQVTAHVLWMTTGLSCEGDSVAMTAATNPSLEDIVQGIIPGMPKVVIHNQVIAYEVGQEFIQAWYDAEEGKLDPFVLIIEGSIGNEQINGEGHWTGFGVNPSNGQPITTNEWVDRLANKAAAVVAIGTCATYGGIPAMKNNPTGAMGLPDYLGWKWKSKAGLPVICIPGCPAQPDNMTEMLLYLVLHLGGLAPAPELDDQLRPVSLFGRTVHESCNRAAFYEHGNFATEYGSDHRCLVKLGCKGPVVKCNVPIRGWVNGIGGCPNVGGICMACTMPGFPDKYMPFMEEDAKGRVSSNVARFTYGPILRWGRAQSIKKVGDHEPAWRKRGTAAHLRVPEALVTGPHANS